MGKRRKLIMRKRRSLDLPEEIWREIFENLREQDLAEVSLVCKQFLSVTNSVKSILKITEHLLPTLPEVLQRFQFLEKIIICTRSLSTVISVPRYFSSRLSHEARMRVKSLDFRVPTEISNNFDFPYLSNFFPMLEEIIFNNDSRLKNMLFVKRFPKPYCPYGPPKLISSLKKLKKIVFNGPCDFLYDESIFSLSSNSECLEEIHIETTDHYVTQNAIGFVLRNSPKLTSLALWSLNESPADSPFTIENSIAYAKNLQSLNFCYMNISEQLVSSIARANPPLKKLTISKDIKIHTMSMFFEAFCSIEVLNLVKIDIHNRHIDKISQFLTKLTCIDLSWCDRMNNHCFFQLTNSCPLLEEIKMDNTQVGLGDISGKELHKHDRILRLSLCENCSLDDKTLKVIARVCSNLRFLDISRCPLLTGKGTSEVFNSCRLLTHLEINYFKFSNIFGKFSKGRSVDLKVLHIKSSKLNDKAMGEIGRICSNLEYLNVGYCRSVTKIGVMEVVRNCKKLEKINLSRCDDLSINDLNIIAQTRPSLKKIFINHDFVPSEVKKNMLKYGCKILDECDILPVVFLPAFYSF